MLLGAQVRSGTMEGENCLAPRTPGNGARRPERKARAGEAPEEKEEEKPYQVGKEATEGNGHVINE